MSFLDDVANAIESVGGAALGKLGVAVDWAKARNSEYEDWARDTPILGSIIRAGDPVRDYLGSEAAEMGEQIETGYREGISEPIATFNTVKRLSLQRADGDWGREMAEKFNPDTWREAYEIAQTTSIGQSAVEAGLVNFAPGQYGDMTQEDILRMRENSTAYNLASGSVDFAARWYLDPLNVAGRSLGMARRAYVMNPVKEGEDIAQAVSEGGRLARRTEGIIGDGTKQWDANQFLEGVEGLKDLPEGAAIASALSKANKVEDAAERKEQMKLVLRLSYGDTSATTELAQKNKEILDQLTKAKSDTNQLIEQEKWREVAPGKTRFVDTPEAKQKIKDHLDALDNFEAQKTAEMERLEQLETSLFATSRARTLRVTGRSQQRAIAQSVQQNSLWNTPRRVFASAPKGYVFLDDSASSAELKAMFDQVPDFDAVKRTSLLSKYIESADPGSRLQIVERAKAAIIAHEAKKLGYTAKQAETAISTYITRERHFFGKKVRGADQRYSAADGADGLPADTFVDEEQVLNAVPQFSTQLANAVPTLDMRVVKRALQREKIRVSSTEEWLNDVDSALGAHYKTAIGRETAKARMGFQEVATDVLDGMSRWWKFSVLFRLGYPLRVLTDDQTRIFAKLGSAAAGLQAEHAWSGLKGLARWWNGNDLRDAKLLLNQDLQQISNLKNVLADSSAEAAEKAAAKTQLAELEAKVELAKKNPVKVYQPALDKRFASGKLSYRGVELDDAFAGPDAQLRKDQTRAHFGDNILFQGEINGYARAAKAGGGWGRVEPGAPGHNEAWLHAVNLQIRQDAMGAKLLAGESEEQVLKWLRSTPEGKAYAKQLPFHSADQERWVSNAKATVDQYIPDENWREILKKRQLTAEDLKAYTAGGGLEPPVHGAVLEYNLGHGAASNMVNSFMSKTMHLMSELPSDKLSRQPLYTAVYRQTAKREIDHLLADPHRAELGLADRITPADMDKVYKVAHASALKELKGTLYDLAAHSNAAGMLRFISPFAGAWEETLKRYWGLVKDKPQLLNYFNLAWQAPNKTGLVVDRDGNPVTDAGELTDDEFLMVQLPGWAGGPTKTDPTRGQFKLFDSVVSIPKSSFNLVLQGDPWWLPGFGPLVQAPVAALAKELPQLEDIATFVNPMGSPDNFLESLEPATAKRIHSWLDSGQTKVDFARDLSRIYGQMYIDWQKGGEAEPWNESKMWAEAEKRTKNLYLLKATNNALSPFPATFRSPYQFYQDAYQLLQDEARKDPKDEKTTQWADDEFLRKYGDTYFEFVQSASRNNLGVEATVAGVKATKRYKDEIEAHPELARYIVGDEDSGEYSPQAAQYQRTHRIRPGSTEKQRSYADPREARKDAERKAGWNEYGKMADQLNAIAQSRGLDSYREDEQLMALARIGREKLMQKNGAWREDFNSFDKDSFERKFEEITSVATSKSLAGRQDIPALQQWVKLRQGFLSLLQQRAAQGGSSSFTAKSNRDLLFLYTRGVNRIAESNTKFDEIWFTPLLERDPMLLDLTAVGGE